MSARSGDDRRFWRILLLIALGALVLRVGYVAFAKTNQPIHGDQLFYNAEANRLARGDGFLEPFDPQALSRGVIREGKDPAADHPPLTVIVLAPVSFVTNQALIPQRLTMSVLGTVAGVVAPWVGYNLARFDEPTYLSTNDGIALLGSNCDSVYFGDGEGLTDLKCLGPNPRGDQSVDSKIFRDRAFDYIRDHKKRAVLVAFARVGRTWSLYRPWDMVSYNKGEGREGWVTTLGLIAYYPLLVAAVAGWVVMRRRRRRSWPLLVPALIVTIASAATYGQTRFRVPAEPTLVVLAAVAIGAVVAHDWPARRKQPARPA